MIEPLISLVVYLLIAGILIWLAFYVLDSIPIPPPFNQIIRVILVVISVLICIYALLGLVGGAPRVRIGGIEPCPSTARCTSTLSARPRSAAL